MRDILKKLIIPVVVIGFVLRVIGINFGLPMAFHPDEPHIINPTQQFYSGDFNPHKFLYPSLYMYLLYFIQRVYFFFGSLVDGMTRNLTSAYLLGRLTTVLFGTATIVLTFFLASKIFNRTIGFISALILSILPLHVLHSHYVTTDVPLTFFVVLTLLFSWFIAERGELRDYILGGIFAGLTISTKIPGVFVLFPLFFAHLLNLQRKYEIKIREVLQREIKSNRSFIVGIVLSILAGTIVFALLDNADKLLTYFPGLFVHKYRVIIAGQLYSMRVIYALIVAFLCLILYIFRRLIFLKPKKFLIAGSLALVSFLVTTPYAFLDAKTFFRDSFDQMVMSKTTWGGKFADTLPGWIYHLKTLMSEVNILFFVLTLLGVFFLFYRFKGNSWLFLSFPFLYYLYIGSWGIKFPRYIMPLLPFVAILGGIAIYEIFKLLILVYTQWKQRLCLLSCGLVFFVGFLNLLEKSVDIDKYFLKTSTKTLAFEWIKENIPEDSHILREQYTPEMELAGYKVTNVLYDFVDRVDQEFIVANKIDYVIISSKLYERPLRDSGVLKTRYERYKEIEKYAELIKEIVPNRNNPGPIIKIYKVTIN